MCVDSPHTLMDTHAKSIRRGLLASSLVSVILGVWLVAQLVPLEAVGLCARDHFAKAMGTAPAQEAALLVERMLGHVTLAAVYVTSAAFAVLAV